MVIKRVGVLKLALFQCVLMGLFGLIAGLFFMIFGSMFARLGGAPNGTMMAGGIVALILFPIMYAVIGFIVGAIGAALYNLVASIIGGVEIDVE